MLPKNPLGRDMFKKLKVFTGDKHPHAAQQPQALKSEIKDIRRMPANTNYGTGRRKTSTARVFLRPAPATSPSTTARSISSSVVRRRA